MKRVASSRVVKRQVRELVPESYGKDPNPWKKLTHPVGKNLPDEDVFLPDDSTEQEFEDNINPKVKALMQRWDHLPLCHFSRSNFLGSQIMVLLG